MRTVLSWINEVRLVRWKETDKKVAYQERDSLSAITNRAMFFDSSSKSNAIEWKFVAH